ncbi:MFS transporter [Hamadaea sp. NPDC050747]|uniref:MFS transporter n=1 Tax=Hamadaea sp. NPDC050747 TaxID=3155789 RepID=UPI0033E11F3F
MAVLDQLDTAAQAASASTAAQAATVKTGRRDRLTLLVLLTAGFTLAVDFSILNVALPVIGGDVGLPLHALQWIATAFALCAAGFTLLFGRIADLFGRRRLFLAGLALLGVSSLAGGLATTPGVLLAARALQGLATAAVTPAALSLLTTSFGEGPRRDKALGLNGALTAAGFTTGAILGGVVTDLLSWRWAFFINVVVAVVVLPIAVRVLPEGRPPARPALDLSGAVTVTLGLLALVYGLTTAGQTSWRDPLVLGSLAAAVALLAAFWVIERRHRQPLVPVSVLRRPTVAWGNFAGLMAFATETSLVFLLTLYLQDVLGYSPLAAGLAFSVLGAGTVAGGLLGPRVIRRLGAKAGIVTALLVQTAATAPLVLLGSDPAWIGLLLPLTFVGGVANLVAIVGFMVTATSGLPDGEQGLATGLTTMSQQVGITLGIPVMSAVVAGSLGSHAGSGAVLRAVTIAVAANAVLCLVAALLIAVFLRTRAGRRA